MTTFLASSGFVVKDLNMPASVLMCNTLPVYCLLEEESNVHKLQRKYDVVLFQSTNKDSLVVVLMTNLRGVLSGTKFTSPDELSSNLSRGCVGDINEDFMGIEIRNLADLVCWYKAKVYLTFEDLLFGCGDEELGLEIFLDLWRDFSNAREAGKDISYFYEFDKIPSYADVRVISASMYKRLFGFDEGEDTLSCFSGIYSEEVEY